MLEIGDLINDTRFSPGFKFGLMVLYFPIGVFLIVCRVLIALHAYMVVCLMPRAAARRQFVRGMLGVLGVHIWVEEEPGGQTDAPKILVSNHTSILDHIVVDVVTSHFVPYHRNVPTVFQWVLGYKDLASGYSKEQFLKNCASFIQEHKLPLLFHPEGAVTNNTGLLKFHTQAFELELPVQPVSIQLSRLSFPCALSTIDSPRWTDVLWCFFVPVTVYKVKTHPIMTKTGAESMEDFAERVREVIGTALNLERTNYTAADVAEYIKKLKATRKQPQRVVQKQSPVERGPSGTGSTSCFDGVDAELRRMIAQVKDVLPQVPAVAVQKDLEQTKDVDVTISNILEGRVEYSLEEEATSNPQSPVSVPDKDLTLFKAMSFSRNPCDRHLSLDERKKLMLETARLRYKDKHNIP
ncbi:lipid droplet-regulating VLDL assembly factor AUP1-like [Mya arenaria]|uniref:lipid droplet-regulating VLDL assembly factor AUP1-like n=1 Tax=Mya arenaria TaxID=6604 RepID=UPI0022E6AEEA|nr:lipid droplet-regulating VLDL assembly factor AUP1-like [Mya arenaria]